jgi:cobalt-zinc-cadmium efflux system membrane fusion protein
MKRIRDNWIKLVILAVAVLGLVAVGVAAGPHVMDWLQKPKAEETAAGGGEAAAVLTFDEVGRPGLRLSGEVVKALHVRTAPAKPVSLERPLPAQLGQVSYDIDHLYPVRSIAVGRVTKVMPNTDPSLSPDPNQPVGFGDVVEKGQLLALVRSPDLADKKGNYVDALLDLHVDKERLRGIEKAYAKGAIAEATYRDAVAKVQKDVTAVSRARRALELVPLKDEEIDKLITESEEIKAKFRALATKTTKPGERLWSREQVEQWARIEVRAPERGTIVEKNTNLGDIADPGKDPPLFRIANLNTLAVWINPAEEYLPIIQQILREQPTREIRMDLRLQSAPHARPIKGKLLRLAPSLDPFNKTPQLIGRIENPGKKLLVGQLLLATVYVPQQRDLVEIPTVALNDVHGESLVFVKTDKFFGGPKYILRRVSVAHRFADVVQVRSRLDLNSAEREKMQRGVRRGLRPIEPLYPGEQVVLGGVVEMTDALESLQAQAKAGAGK